MRWRLGVDLGTNSLGWAAIELDEDARPRRIAAIGSRIHADGREPKSGASLATARREARSMRRRRDRYLQRRQALLKHLTLAGLLPEAEPERQALVALDPFALRARALHDALPLHQLGRALFHLSQRRGFRSNRKVERGQNSEDGKIRLGVARLQEAMRDAGAATLGEYLHGRRAAAEDDNAVPSVRTRLRPRGSGLAGGEYDFYPDRQMLEDEFDAIWTAQAPHHPDALTALTRNQLVEVIFHQRPLRRPKVGTCTFLPGEQRLPKAHPLFQTRRLLEEVNALRIVRPGVVAKPLTREQRDLLYLRLRDRRSVTFEALRKLLRLEPEARLNKESEQRRDMKGDEVAAELGAKTRFGTRWATLSVEAQWEVVSRVREQESDTDETELVAWLRDRHGLSDEQARAVTGARLPEGHGRFGPTATTRLIQALRDHVIVYSNAVKQAGFAHHSDFRTGAVLDALPYYGVVLERHIMPGTANPDDPEEMRVGRLTNPTVHIGLNQLRRVVNRLIRRYGPPHQVVLELARELKLSDERKRELDKRSKQNRDGAELRSGKLLEIGQVDKGGNRLLLKLWEELNPDNVLDRRCVYTGRQISLGMLFSDAVEVDHILPYKDTLDDSTANKLLCLRKANRDKGKQSPFKAFGPGDDWPEIAARASRLPREKRWRFEPDAMTRFDDRGGFLARHLVDTQYLSRLARDYLSALYPGSGEDSGRVWVSPGRLTEMLRRSWGLNGLLPDHNHGGGADQPKNRLDHRHHAIDAVVIGLTDRGLLNRISQEAGQRGHEAAGRMTAGLPVPWEGFADELRHAVRQVVVSHRVDHGTTPKSGATAGLLHNDTAYGLTHDTDPKGKALVVHRVPLAALAKPANLDAVRDPTLRDALRAWTAGLDGEAFEARLRQFPQAGPACFCGIRHVRVVEPLTVIPIRDRQGRAYKGYKGDSNHRCDVWALKDGQWVAEVVSMFDAHQPAWQSAVRRDNPTARKVLSLHQNDMLAIEPPGQPRKLVRVVSLGQNGQVTLAEPHEGGDLKRRNAAPNDVDPFKYFSPTAGGLKRLRARKVGIDELGTVLHDPGPREPAGAAG